MNNYKRILVLLLTFIMLFCSACSSGNGDGGDGNGQVNTSSYDKITYEGTHEFNWTETNNYLVKDGKSDYSIVLPANPNKYETWAKDELLFFFEEATGVTLPVISDRQATFSSSAKYISLGSTTLATSAGVKVDSEKLKKDGVRIVTEGQTIFICGGGYPGVVYGVYDFLQVEFNYDYYYKGMYRLDKKYNVKLKDYDLTDIPDLESRAMSCGWYRDYDGTLQSAYRYRMTYTDNGYLYLPGGRSTHNALDILPLEKYKADHPKWYSGNFLQPCFTAHGDEAELEKMITTVAESFIETLGKSLPQNNYEKMAISFTIEDGPYHCYCSACEASAKKYGGYESAAVILFMNRLAEKVNAWMDAPENADYKRDLKYVFFGYNYYANAPVYYDESDDTYKVLAPELQPHEDVGVFLAIKNTDYYQTVYMEKNYKSCIEAIQQWSDILDFVMLWTYDANYHNKLMPDDRVGYFDEDYFQAMAGLGIDYYFQEGLGQYGGCTHFSDLKGYLVSKQTWDSTLSTTELTENWFKGMFKEAWQTMYDYYEDLRMFNLQTRTNNIIGGNNQVRAEYWPYQTIMKWANYCEKATLEIEEYKYTNPDLYKKLLNNINCQRVMQDYLFIELYPNYFSNAQLNEIKLRLKQTVLDNEGIGISAKGDLADYVENF